MLYPQVNEARNVLALDGIWKFSLNAEAETGENWMASPLKDPEYMAVPGSYNDQKEGQRYKEHYGKVYYQRSFYIPNFMKKERIMLRFGAVTHHAEVYLNGRLICRHKGGFLPFEIQINDSIIEGENLLSLTADNRIDYSTLPVGNENGKDFFGAENPDIESFRHLKPVEHNIPNFDYFNYSGIHRPVKLYTTPKDYIKDIVLTTSLDGNTGIVNYQIDSVGCGAAKIKIIDEQGDIIGTCDGPNGTVRIPDVHLWEPGNAFLYRAEASFGSDRYEEEFGVRTVEVTETKFLINGKPFYFKGFSKHEDSANHGRGLDEVLNVKDLDLMKWIHANSFRTAHYPYAEEMLRLCDREGIVVIGETPAVGLYFRKDDTEGGYKKFRTKEHHEEVIRDMIDRDKNHPSIVMWSIANEPQTALQAEAARDYLYPLYELAHQCDPQNRPVTLVANGNEYRNNLISPMMDVICLNRYYGWYWLGGDLDRAKEAFAYEMEYWGGLGKPIMIAEYGADAVAGIHTVTPVMFSEEYQAEYYQAMNEVLDQVPAVVGEQVWNFADYATPQGLKRVDGNKKGIFTRDRRPKLAAHYFRQRWNGIPDFGYKR